MAIPFYISSSPVPNVVMPRSNHLLIIDPQNDFCDLPESYLPTDPVTGAAHAPAHEFKKWIAAGRPRFGERTIFS